ncbi:hypothetical protein RND81_05G173900 [Saponaria officinalis]|uniref:Uncharacterized protein n=1 Tax=Saponaria officinalis TaxID=3572 RepID=A0AAW1L1W9_SAPOF
MTVAIYFSKLKVLWDELDKHEPLISCSCGKCTCGIGKQHVERRESDRLHQFLLGLNVEVYSSIRSTLLSQDPLPSLNRAFQAISQEERVRSMARMHDNQPEVTGFTIRLDRSKPRLSRAERAPLKCTHCKKFGHDITTCFELQDEVPAWYIEKYGHKNTIKATARDKQATSTPTSSRGRDSVRAHTTTSEPIHPSFASEPRFTAEQWQTYQANSHNPSLSSNRSNGKWIIDTGCSNHVTGPPYEGGDWYG